MTSGNAVSQVAVSRIGQRRQVVIPKRLVDVGDNTLTAREAAQVRRGDAEIKAGNSRSWRVAKDELGL